MSKLHIAIGIFLFAVASAILYVWGLKKSVNQQADMTRILLSRCGNRIIKYLKKHESITLSEAARQIDGVTASEFWSRKRLTVMEPEKFAVQVVQFLVEQQYLEPAGNQCYRLKK